MKKLILLCFLGLLCLFGSNIQGQSRVASSPEVPNFPHSKKASQRSGETRSTSPPGFSLVDDSISFGQGILDSLAGGEVLIYGELINPDSLGPLKILFRPYYLTSKTDLGNLEVIPELQYGTFFDGVLDPRARKFLVRSPALERPGYLSVELGDRHLLEEYLIFPGDSIKLGINLQDNFLHFAGPDWTSYELQYQLKRKLTHQEFDQPRKLVLGDPESLLSQSNHRQQWVAQEEVFGARLEFESFQFENLIKLMGQLEEMQSQLKKESNSGASENLHSPKVDLIDLDYQAARIYPLLNTLFRFYYPNFESLVPESLQAETQDRIEKAMENLSFADYSAEQKLVSAQWLDLEIDRLSLLALIRKQSFLELLQNQYSGELADRIGVAFLTQNLRRYPDPVLVLKDYSWIQTYPWKDKLDALYSATVPGEALMDLEMEDLDGDTFHLRDTYGRPTLLYFYFSTCVHSAHYFKDLLFPFYQSKAKDSGVNLIAISVDRDRELWESQLKEYSDSSLENYLLSQDSYQNWRRHYEISGFPRTFLIDSHGKIISFGLSRESDSAFEADFDQAMNSIRQ